MARCSERHRERERGRESNCCSLWNAFRHSWKFLAAIATQRGCLFPSVSNGSPICLLREIRICDADEGSRFCFQCRRNNLKLLAQGKNLFIPFGDFVFKGGTCVSLPTESQRVPVLVLYWSCRVHEGLAMQLKIPVLFFRSPVGGFRSQAGRCRKKVFFPRMAFGCRRDMWCIRRPERTTVQFLEGLPIAGRTCGSTRRARSLSLRASGA